MTNRDHADHLHPAPDNAENPSGVDKFMSRVRLSPEEAEAAYRGASMLLAALKTAERPELSAAAKAELERRGADPACIVVDDSGGATVHNSPEQAAMALYGPDWSTALEIVLTTPRAPQ